MNRKNFINFLQKNRNRDTWPREEYHKFQGLVMSHYALLLDHIDKLEERIDEYKHDSIERNLRD